MNIKKNFIIKLLFIFCILSLFFTGNCKKKEKIYNVGILSGLKFFEPNVHSFKDKMADIGYVEGVNIEYDLISINFDMKAYEDSIKKFVDEKVDLIFVSPTDACLVAKQVTKGTGIPVVFNVTFIEGVDLINSIQQPGENITGVRYPGPDIAVKRLEILLNIVPDAKIIWVPYIKDYPVVPAQIEALKSAGKSMGLTFIEAPVENPAQIQESLNKYGKKIDAMLTLAEPLSVTPELFEVFAKYANKNKIPLGGAYFNAGEYGSIFGVNIDIEKSGETAAIIADKILKGADPGTTPVISAENYIEVDYKRATEQGLTIPDSVLKQADRIIR